MISQDESRPLLSAIFVNLFYYEALTTYSNARAISSSALLTDLLPAMRGHVHHNRHIRRHEYESFEKHHHQLAIDFKGYELNP